LAHKLELSLQEWQEIQSEFQNQSGEMKPFKWGRNSVSGLVEVYCVDPASPSPKRSGPVFFFRRDDGHWRMLREASGWDKD
jgi:hypothetical protein